MTPKERAARVIRIIVEGDITMDNIKFEDLIAREIEDALKAYEALLLDNLVKYSEWGKKVCQILEKTPLEDRDVEGKK